MVCGKLVVKEFGAQKIYCAKQGQLSGKADDSSRLKSKLEKLRDSLASSRASYEETSRALGVYKSYERNLSSRNSISECIHKLSTQICSLKAKHSASTHSPEIDLLSADELEADMTKVRSELEKRRRICLRMITEISEQMGMSRSTLIEDLGLEMCESNSARGS